MTFRLRRIEHTSDGREIVREKDIAKAELTVGRGAENDIHLADLAVETQHARIVQSGEGRIRVEAVGTLGFTIDGAAAKSAGIDPRTGAELRFGSTRISVSLGADSVVLLTIQLVAEKSDAQPVDEKSGFSLIGSLPGKRVLSWILGIVILAAFLAVPIVSSLTRAPDAKTGVIGDKAWSSGPLSLAHHSLETRCEACHAKPFEAVRDQTCLSCHKDVIDHAPPARTAGARAEPGLGGKFLGAVAHGFGKPGPGACVDCHSEHEGAGPMEPAPQKFCADCHGALDQRLTDTKLGNAADFGKLHPQFRVRIPTVPGSPVMTRISLDAHPKEASGLSFPHKLHLDPLGGAARMAASLGAGQGYGKRMVCSDCHSPTEDGVRFQPVNMERDCETCHSLAYDRVGSIFRTLRHGDVAQMKADLRAADHGQPIITGRRRPGEFSSGGLYYSSFSGPAGSEAMIRRALSRDGVCGECHKPVLRNGGLTIMPVTQVSRSMINGWFDHKAHRQENCTSCHAAGKSKSSADVLLPGIKHCQTCHLGEDASQAKVPSSCTMCHAYHPTALAPRARRQGKD